MNLVILHYHLNRGGVTQVVRNQLLALDSVIDPAEPWRVAIVHGGRARDWPDDFPAQLRHIGLSMEVLDRLDYDEVRGGDQPEPEELATQLVALLDHLGFAPAETVVHVHNHALGKNVSLPGAIASLARRDYALLLQIHDFAEDGRPGNFRKLSVLTEADAPNDWHGSLYPQAAHVHYAALNSRDAGILRSAAIDSDRLHLLPNPAPEPYRLPDRAAVRRKLTERFAVGPTEQLVLYPVRAIRRKNLGEALLYSRLAPAGTVIGLTLKPLNPALASIYRDWTQLADELELPCRFELGEAGGLTFQENLAASDRILTTSVAEGFGMVFLESWLAGRTLVGRDLPDITADFKRAGVRLDALRPRLDVPVGWIGPNAFRRRVLDAYRRSLADYGRDEPPQAKGQLEAKLADGRIDFGELDEPFQQQVIRIAAEDETSRRTLLDLNPWLTASFEINPPTADGLIRDNIEAVQRSFSREPIGRQLLKVYEQVSRSDRSGGCSPLGGAGRILDSFLDLSHFRLLRS